MSDDKTTYEIRTTVTYTSERPTGRLRFVRRSRDIEGYIGTALILQHEIAVSTHGPGTSVTQRLEWRDVPVDEEGA